MDGVLRFIKIVNPGPAHRANPVRRQIFEGGAWFNPALRISIGGVVDVSAHTTDIFLHFQISL
jgi:hypothetical protein